MSRTKGLLLLADVVKRLLAERKMNQLQLVERMNGKVKQSNLSAALSGKRNFTLTMLDTITEALGMEKGALYTYFVPECFDRYGNLRPKKTVDFLLECYRLGLQTVVDRLAEELIESGKKHADVLFSLAEQLKHTGMEEEALTYYLAVVQLELGQVEVSDRWLISLYRAFHIQRDKGLPEASEAVVYLHTFLRNLSPLPEGKQISPINELQLLAYQEVISYYFEQEQWEKTVQTCSEYLHLQKDAEWNAACEEVIMQKCEAHCRLHQYGAALQTAEDFLSSQKKRNSDWQAYFQLLRYREKTAKGEVPSTSGYIAWVRRNPRYLIPSLSYLLKVFLEKKRWKDIELLLAHIEIPFEIIEVSEQMIGFELAFLQIQRYLAEYYFKAAKGEEAGKRLLAAVRLAIGQRTYQELLANVLLFQEFAEELSDWKKEQIKDMLERAVLSPMTK